MRCGRKSLGAIPSLGIFLIREGVGAGRLVPAAARSNGWMAERSKALVSGTSLFGGVGSNPTPIIFLLVKARRHETFWEPREALPSSIGTRGLVGYDACFTRRKSRVRSSAGVLFGRAFFFAGAKKKQAGHKNISLEGLEPPIS